MTTVLGIYVKHPLAGQVKTRLAATLGHAAATELYLAFVQDLLGRFQTTADRRFLCFSPDTPEARQWFIEQGGDDYELWPQPDGNLEPRLQQFFEFAHNRAGDRVVVIGSDSPTLSLDQVEYAFQQLQDRDCMLGPATDGGYYLLGLRKPLPIFQEIPWSTPQVLQTTIDRLHQCQATLDLLPFLYDVDTVEDLELLKGHLHALELMNDPLLDTLAYTRTALHAKK